MAVTMNNNARPGDADRDAGASPLRASVVIPAYNAAAVLPGALTALGAQTLPAGSFEVIVVDDGSRDETAAVAGRLGARVLRQENRGPGAARNAGARAARGEILLFTDADCEPAPDWLERMLAPFADPAAAGAQGAYLTRQRSLAARFAQLEFEDRYRLQAKNARISMVATYAAAYRRDIFLENGGFDERFTEANNEDAEFSYRLHGKGKKLVFVPLARTYHRHPGTLRRYLRVKFLRAYWRMFVYRDHPGKIAHDGYTPQSVKFQALCGAGMLAAALPALVWPLMQAAFWLCFWGAFLSGLPFAARSFAKDPAAALAAPGIILLRSLVFGAGSLYGAFRARTW